MCQNMHGKRLFVTLFTRSPEIMRKNLSFKEQIYYLYMAYLHVYVRLFVSKLFFKYFIDNTASSFALLMVLRVKR